MIIATRTLKLRDADGDTDIPIRVFAPEEASDGSWSCHYEIDWPEGLWSMKSGGVDSVQAIFLALQMIGSEIYATTYHKAGQLFFESPGRGYGFPVATTLRDQLVGDDKKFL
jgi:hypothetical protein